MSFDELFDFMMRPLNSNEEIAETRRVASEWIASHPEDVEMIHDFDDHFNNEMLRLELVKNGRNPQVMTFEQLMYILI